MDDGRLDAAAKALATLGTRRAALRLVAVGAFGTVLARLGLQQAAAACRKNGKECTRGGQCCSGLCKRRTCRPAPGQDICTIEADACRGTDPNGCGGGQQPCNCYVTARGASFCGAGSFAHVCSSCVDDRDCEFVTGPGSACVRLDQFCGCGGDDFGFTRRCVPRC